MCNNFWNHWASHGEAFDHLTMSCCVLLLLVARIIRVEKAIHHQCSPVLIDRSNLDVADESDRVRVLDEELIDCSRAETVWFIAVKAEVVLCWDIESLLSHLCSTSISDSFSLCWCSISCTLTVKNRNNDNHSGSILLILTCFTFFEPELTDALFYSIRILIILWVSISGPNVHDTFYKGFKLLTSTICGVLPVYPVMVISTAKSGSKEQ